MLRTCGAVEARRYGAYSVAGKWQALCRIICVVVADMTHPHHRGAVARDPWAAAHGGAFASFISIFLQGWSARMNQIPAQTARLNFR